jgi:hypothetical protein
MLQLISFFLVAYSYFLIARIFLISRRAFRRISMAQVSPTDEENRGHPCFLIPCPPMARLPRENRLNVSVPLFPRFSQVMSGRLHP